MRNWDGVTNGEALCIDQNFFHQQPQNLLTLTNIQRLRARLQLFSKRVQIFRKL